MDFFIAGRNVFFYVCFWIEFPCPLLWLPQLFSGLSVIYRDGEIEVWVGIDRCLSRSIECVGDRLRENHYSGFDGVVMVWD